MLTPCLWLGFRFSSCRRLQLSKSINADDLSTSGGICANSGHHGTAESLSRAAVQLHTPPSSSHGPHSVQARAVLVHLRSGRRTQAANEVAYAPQFAVPQNIESLRILLLHEAARYEPRSSLGRRGITERKAHPRQGCRRAAVHCRQAWIQKYSERQLKGSKSASADPGSKIHPAIQRSLFGLVQGNTATQRHCGCPSCPWFWQLESPLLNLELQREGLYASSLGECLHLA